MTEDIRRDTDRTGQSDRRDEQLEAAHGDEQVGRRDVEPSYGEEQVGRRDVEPSYGDDQVGARNGDSLQVDDRDTNRDPTSERRPTAGPGTTTAWTNDGLLDADDRGSYQKRWDDIQVRFIDEPRQCVREADDLVSEVTTRISDRFSSARQDMEQRWDGGDEPTTEELRQAVQRYRDFFQRLVAQ